MGKSVVYIGPKYIDKDCDIVVPDNHITVGSLESSGVFDKVYPLYWEKNSENDIVDFCYNSKPDLAVFGGLTSYRFDTLKVLICLNQLKIPIVYLWWDHTSPQNQELVKKISPFVTLNVVMDIIEKDEEKIIYKWYPLDSRIFCDVSKDKNIDVSFCGTIIPEFMDRIHYLSLLEKSGYKVFLKTGVYRDNPLKIEEYADILQRSKICLNFTMLPQYNTHQLKTRTHEVLSCNSFLLESDNNITNKRFEKNKDYMTFLDFEDLKNKIDFYLKNEKKRKEISYSGYKKIKDKYNEKKFWQEINLRISCQK